MTIGALLRRGWIRAVLAASVMLALAPAVRAQQQLAIASPVHTASVRVTVGKTEDVRTDQTFANITVGDPDVADVSPLTDHSLSILGKKIGTTRVTVYDADHKAVGIFDVEVSYDISRLAVEIDHFTGGGIKVSSINGRILLSGTSPDAVDARQGGADREPVRPGSDQYGPGHAAAADRARSPLHRSRPQRRPRPRRAMERVRQFGAGQYRLRVAGLATADHAAERLVPAAGFRRRRSSAAPTWRRTALPISPVVASGVLSGAAPFGFLIGQLSNKLQIEVNALESKGAARLLAEPNLVTLSGETASFLAGGQIPIPEVGATGTPSFGFQPYGVGLSFTPTVLRNGVINLIVKPEVSEIDKSNGVTVAGTFVPGLTTRKASTTLELRDGQSFMLGGLLQSDGTNNINQLPWVGDLPVLGALFRSTDYQKQETDLVILVTPHIVRPMTPTDPVHTPFDSSLPPNDVDLFMMGDTEVSPELARLAIGALNRPYVGHILDLPKNGGVYVTAKD